VKVAVCAQANDMNAPVDPRFGRCAGFVIVDTESGETQGLPNTGAAAASGAGIQTAQMVVEQGVEAVLVGNIGPRAISVLDAAGIAVHGGVSGTVAEAVEEFKQGNLPRMGGANVPSHAGLRGPGGGGGFGGGGGGFGGGGGRGQRGGQGRGQGGGFGGGGGFGQGRGQGRGQGGGRRGNR